MAQLVPNAVCGPRGRPRDPARDEAILGAALGLVAECGYERTTVDKIAARAGVSKPTIYRRWPHGKDELVAAAVSARREDMKPDIDTGSLRGDLLALVAQNVESVRDNAQLVVGL